jgi:riboflavin biosynthesis pyrimidine reductase
MMPSSTASRLAPFQALYDISAGEDLPLPHELASIYGPLRMPSHAGRVHVIGNLVTSLDGVVSLGIPGKEGGKAISGSNEHDRALMGVLRASANAIIMGAGTLRTSPKHLLTPGYAHPPLAEAYSEFRRALGKPEAPLSVIITATGEVDASAALFGTGAPVLVVTTPAGRARLRNLGLPPWVRVEVPEGAQPGSESSLTAAAMLSVVGRTLHGSGGVVLVEGGPHLIGTFFGDGCLDEMFLTLSPQVVGRDGSAERPGLAEGRSLAPEHPSWGTLVGVRRAGSHLFLRYRFGREQAASETTRGEQ